MATIDDEIKVGIDRLKKLSPQSKKKIIKSLMESLEDPTLNIQKEDFENLYGKWKDRRTAEEIIELIYESRINSINIDMKKVNLTTQELNNFAVSQINKSTIQQINN